MSSGIPAHHLRRWRRLSSDKQLDITAHYRLNLFFSMCDSIPLLGVGSGWKLH